VIELRASVLGYLDTGILSVDVVQRLDEIKLFDFMPDEDLVRWAGKFRREHFHRGAEVIRQGVASTAFYVVDEGELLARERVGDQDLPRAYFFVGDYFGEASLLTGQPYNATIEVLTDSELLVLQQGDFDQLVEEFPDIREQLRAVSRQRGRAARLRFPWQEPDEVTILFSSKHWIALVRDQWYGLLLIIPALFASLLFLRTSDDFLAVILMLISGTLWALAVLVSVYNYLDWRNDHYIVTNLRVLQVERVLAVREERDEAPIERVQDVQVRQSGFLANFFDYGDIVIQTAATTQRIVFRYIPNPTYVQDLVLVARRRAPSRERVARRESIREELGSRLNIPLTADGDGAGTPEESSTKPLTEDQPEQTEEAGFDVSAWLRPIWNWMKGLVSFETWLISDGGNTITWRKNGWLLVRESLAPFFLGLIFAALFLLFLSQGIVFPILPLLMLTGLGVILVWWFYRYWDWQNDIYQISGDRLLDLKKQPLWLEELRRETTLDRVQNVSLNIPNAIAHLFNYGTVVIETAGEIGAFTFEYVHDPRGVQQEIFRRRERYQQLQRYQETLRRHTELGEWFEIYDELRQNPEGSAPSEGAVEDEFETDSTFG
jgi:membrane protein YdbS with pleckstrin-like domain